MKRKFHLLIFCLFYLSFCSISANQLTQNDQVIELQVGNYTLGELLQKLEKIPNLNLSYNKNNLPLGIVITIDQTNPTVLQLTRYINKQGQVEAILKDNYLVFREKQLEKDYTITGVVTDQDSREAMVGVNIYIKGELKGAITNGLGFYSISLAPGEYTLVYSFIGYTPCEIKISAYSDKVQNVQLNMEETLLNEVRIVGERHFFGNLNDGRTIETVKMKEIKSVQTNNVSDVIQARLPGVWVTKVSGAPGDHNQIRIRGLNSLFGAVDPLYVIDGVPVPIVNLHSLGISDLNIHDVANITVLKDASSNAIYGFQGGNGVIIIDTKRGGEKEMNFSVTQGIQKAPVRYNLYNSEELINNLLLATKNGYDSVHHLYPTITDTLSSQDYQNQLFRLGHISEYQLSASGTAYKTKYYLSGNYYNHKGVIANTNYSKYSFSASFGHDFFNRLSLEGLYKTSFQQNRNNLDSYWGNRVIVEEINKAPTYNNTPKKYYFESPDVEYVRGYLEYFDLHTLENPDSLIKKTVKQLDVVSHNFSGFASLRILNNLHLNYSISYAFRNHRYQTDILAYQYYRKFNNYLRSHEEYALANNQVNLTYNQKLNKHSINLVTGVKLYRDMVKWNTDSLINDISSQTAQENLFTRGNLAILGEDGKAIRHINSFLVHLNYNYDNKYFFSLAANTENLKEGTLTKITKFFPSVALKWDLAKEAGLNKLKNLDYLHLIYNWGRSGNYPLNGLSRNLYSSESYILPDGMEYGYTVENLANRHLKPEIVEGHNLGTEISLFNKRLIFQANYFSKTNRNLILQRNVPYYYGGGRYVVNIAEMDINGYEYKIEAIPVSKSNWQWYTRLNLSTFRQQVKKLDGVDEYFFNDDILIPDFVVQEDKKLGNILGYKYLGKVKPGTSQEDFENVLFVDGGMYENMDTTATKLGETNKEVIGNILPDFTFSIYNSLKYKNLTLNMLWYAVIGVDKYNATRASTYITGLNSELSDFVADTNRVIASKAFYQSSYFVEDASFIRLKSISLSYSPEKPIYSKIHLTLTLSADNLITLTHYKGYDPEATIYTDNTFSDNAVDFGAYPNPRAYYIIINLRF